MIFKFLGAKNYSLCNLTPFSFGEGLEMRLFYIFPQKRSSFKTLFILGRKQTASKMNNV